MEKIRYKGHAIGHNEFIVNISEEKLLEKYGNAGPEDK